MVAMDWGVARDCRAAGAWTGEPVDRLRLGYDDRFRRRMRLTTVSGGTVMLDLADARVLTDGDALVLADGRTVAVEAAPEPLLEIRAQDIAHLARLAWHIGNRHVAADLNAERILIRDDYVLADMLRGLGAVVTSVTAPFNPEHGAYHSHGPAHAHAHAHSHQQAHAHGHHHDH